MLSMGYEKIQILISVDLFVLLGSVRERRGELEKGVQDELKRKRINEMKVFRHLPHHTLTERKTKERECQ